MKFWVLDANIAVWSVLPGPYQQEAERLIHEADHIVVPSLWKYEVASAIRKVMVQIGGKAEDAQRLLDLLFDIPDEVIEADATLLMAAYTWAERLGQRVVYDAVYVALAESMGRLLWTGDKRLCRQARAAGADFVRCLVKSD